MRKAVPLDNASALIPERLGLALHPAVSAIGTTQAILHEKALASGEATVECFPQAGRILGMNDGGYEGRQPVRVRHVRVCYVEAEKIDQALVEEGRLAVRRQPPEVARNHVDELRERLLSVVQRSLGGHQVVDVDAHTVPLQNMTILVAERLRASLGPAIAAVGAPLAISLHVRHARCE